MNNLSISLVFNIIGNIWENGGTRQNIEQKSNRFTIVFDILMQTFYILKDVVLMHICIHFSVIN